MGAGDSRQRSDLLAGLPLISKTKRECPVGTPSFVLSGGIAAWGKGLPSVARCAGPRPTRPCGLRAAHPAHPVRRRCRRPPGLPAAVREMWRLVAACRRLRPSQPPAVARGHPVRPQGQAPAGPLRGPCPRPAPRRLRRWCSGAARPPRCGGCGAVRPSGPVGGASASLASPATPAAQAGPRGSAYALAARRSGPAGLALAHQWAAPSRPAGARPPAGG